jgi:hypothetical protein
LLEARWTGRRLNELSVRSLNLGDKVAEAYVVTAYRPMLSPSFVTLFAYIYSQMKKSSKWRPRAGLQETFAPRANDYLRVSPSPHPCKQDYRFAMTYEYTCDIREATLGNGHTHVVKFIVDNVEVMRATGFGTTCSRCLVTVSSFTSFPTPREAVFHPV